MPDAGGYIFGLVKSMSNSGRKAGQRANRHGDCGPRLGKCWRTIHTFGWMRSEVTALLSTKLRMTGRTESGAIREAYVTIHSTSGDKVGTASPQPLEKIGGPG